MRTRFLALFAATLAVLALHPLSARATAITSVVVYGDSLSDNGNLYAASSVIGIPTPPSPPYYNGRFSNGPVAVEQLASQLGATLTDHAFGGATTGVGNIADGGTQTTLGVYGLPGIATEFELFPPPTGNLDSTLFVVWGGADDFESGGSPITAANNIDTLVTELEADGATNILVPNLPDLGETPEFAGNPVASAYTAAFNAELAANLPAGATPFNTYALLNSILAGAPGNGFTNTSGYCLQNPSALPDCAGDLFFDDIHPTTAADTILAQNFAAAVAPTPEPTSLVLLGTGLLGTTMLRRKRKQA